MKNCDDKLARDNTASLVGSPRADEHKNRLAEALTRPGVRESN